MTPKARDVLTEHQRAVAERAIAEEASRRRHVVVSLSGAHAYGFPSPDSDLDIKAVHIDPTPALLGFPRSSPAAERLEIVDGVEIDYSSNELGGVLLGALKGNGNFIERFASGFSLAETPLSEELTPLVKRSLSRRLFRHYSGFAAQQRIEWEKTGRRSAKKLLYVLRTVLTGVHALSQREVVTDVTVLLDAYGFPDARSLIEQKKRGEKADLPGSLSNDWAARLPELFARLDRAREQSPLPEDPPNESELEAWLVQTRLTWLK